MPTDLTPSKERTVLVYVECDKFAQADDLAEFRELAKSTGAQIVSTVTAFRQTPDAKYFVGSGKVEAIKQTVMAHNATLVLFNHALSPSQERNLERALECRVLNRQGLILDVFAQRARTFEGKLQVELALLQHLSTRLIRGWTHLERQKGGIGLRGPGETQLETDRRLLRERIKTIRKRLEKVKSQRELSRHTRHRAAIPTIALVGYTNAGKSTIFNQLTEENTYVADQLFATLDPTLRRIALPGGGQTIVADTVGFIRNLPHELIEAFSATLEETRDADLILHITDIHHPDRLLHKQQVNTVLKQIGADTVPQIQIYNKIDLVGDLAPKIDRNAEGKPSEVWLSALTGVGFDLLIQAINEHLYGEPIRRQVCLLPHEGQLRAQLYAIHAVEKESIDENGNWLLSIKLSKHDFEHLFPTKPTTLP